MYRRFTSDQKESFAGVSGVTITTYTMVSYSGRRSEESARVMDEIASREWGLLLLDEVHVVPAQMFRKVRLRLTHRGLASTVFWDTYFAALAPAAISDIGITAFLPVGGPGVLLFVRTYSSCRTAVATCSACRDCDICGICGVMCLEASRCFFVICCNWCS